MHIGNEKIREHTVEDTGSLECAGERVEIELLEYCAQGDVSVTDGPYIEPGLGVGTAADLEGNHSNVCYMLAKRKRHLDFDKLNPERSMKRTVNSLYDPLNQRCLSESWSKRAGSLEY